MLRKLILEVAEQERMITALQELSLTGDFVAEASVDTIRSSSRPMLASVTARRALWLKSWTADAASKTGVRSHTMEQTFLEKS